jgi:MinD superfamily P-loop ATPase
MFEEQEAEKGGKVEGRSKCGGCGGCEVEPRSSVNTNICTAGELHRKENKYNSTLDLDHTADAGGLKLSGGGIRHSVA